MNWSMPGHCWWFERGCVVWIGGMTLRSTSTLHTPRPRGKLVGRVGSRSTKEVPAQPSPSFYLDFNSFCTVSRLTRTSDTDRANSSVMA